MKVFQSLLFFIFLLVAHCTYAGAANFEIQNNCPYTVWAASRPIGGGRQLNPGEVWNINVPAGTTQGRIWARTNCIFDTTGVGKCETGDCNGRLECQTFGTPPNTMAEYALNQFDNLDIFDISLIDGFNVPMNFSPVHPASNGCNLVGYSGSEYIGKNFYVTVVDRFNVPMEFSSASLVGCTNSINCTADIVGQCPPELQAPGGCNNPCTVFKTNLYCCYNIGECRPTNYSKFFKERCPHVYSYPNHDPASTFTCPSGTNYKVVFCP